MIDSIKITYLPPGNWPVSAPARFITIIQADGKVTQQAFNYRGVLLSTDIIQTDTSRLFDWLNRWANRMVEVHKYDRIQTPVRVEFLEGNQRAGVIWKMGWNRKIDRVLLKGIYECVKKEDASYMVSMIRHEK